MPLPRKKFDPVLVLCMSRHRQYIPGTGEGESAWYNGGEMKGLRSEQRLGCRNTVLGEVALFIIRRKSMIQVRIYSFTLQMSLD